MERFDRRDGLEKDPAGILHVWCYRGHGDRCGWKLGGRGSWLHHEDAPRRAIQTSGGPMGRNICPLTLTAGRHSMPRTERPSTAGQAGRFGWLGGNQIQKEGGPSTPRRPAASYFCVTPSSPTNQESTHLLTPRKRSVGEKVSTVPSLLMRFSIFSVSPGPDIACREEPATNDERGGFPPKTRRWSVGRVQSAHPPFRAGDETPRERLGLIPSLRPEQKVHLR